jgi:hypothetical protein
MHEDVPFTKTMRAAIDREMTDLAKWLDPPQAWDVSGGSDTS